MSRCILDDEARSIEVAIGWDPGTQSYFAQVFDNGAARRARNAGASYDEIEAAGQILRTGGYDRIFRQPDELITAIKPYASAFSDDRLRVELLRDQRENDGERRYSLVEGVC
jgi:hypothetical protein